MPLKFCSMGLCSNYRKTAATVRGFNMPIRGGHRVQQVEQDDFISYVNISDKKEKLPMLLFVFCCVNFRPCIIFNELDKA